MVEGKRYHYTTYVSGLGVLGFVIVDSGTLPPINRLFRVQINIFQRRFSETKLDLFWKTVEPAVYFVRECLVDNEELRAQYRLYPDIFETITAHIVSRKSESHSDGKLEIAADLPEEEIPDDLLPVVARIRTWKEFLDSREIGYGRYQLCKDDWCEIHVDSSLLTYHSDSDRQQYFGFNPKVQPPKIEEESICWEIPDIRVRYRLSHSFSNSKIAQEYGYLEVYQQYYQKREDKKKAQEQQQAQALQDQKRQEAIILQKFRAQLLAET